MPKKIPTQSNLETYTGAHTSALWNTTSADWSCPVCNRTKLQIMTWTKRKPSSFCPDGGWGWLAELCMQVDRPNWPFGQQRFDGTIICRHCNRAGDNAKRKMELSSEFRFSPQELARFVTACPHEKAKFDLDEARLIVRELQASGINPIAYN